MSAVDLSAMRALFDTIKVVFPFPFPFNLSIAFQAADEIERLREELADARNSAEGYHHHVADMTAERDRTRAERDEARRRMSIADANVAAWDAAHGRLERELAVVTAERAQLREALVTYAQDRRQLEDALTLLLVTLPTCDGVPDENGAVKRSHPPCPRPATRAYERGALRYCDTCGPNVPPYPRAQAIREALALLRALGRHAVFRAAAP